MIGEKMQAVGRASRRAAPGMSSACRAARTADGQQDSQRTGQPAGSWRERTSLCASELRLTFRSLRAG